MTLVIVGKISESLGDIVFTSFILILANISLSIVVCNIIFYCS